MYKECNWVGMVMMYGWNENVYGMALVRSLQIVVWLSLVKRSVEEMNMHFVFEVMMLVDVISGDDKDDVLVVVLSQLDKEIQLIISLLPFITTCVKRIPVTSPPTLAEIMLFPIENNNTNEK